MADRPALENYRAARERARAARRGETLYPRLMVLGGEWVRQDAEGGPFVVIQPAQASRELLGETTARSEAEAAGFLLAGEPTR